MNQLSEGKVCCYHGASDETMKKEKGEGLPYQSCSSPKPKNGSRTIEFAIWGDDKRPSEVPECSNKTYTGGTTDDRRKGYHLFGGADVFLDDSDYDTQAFSVSHGTPVAQ